MKKTPAAVLIALCMLLTLCIGVQAQVSSMAARKVAVQPTRVTMKDGTTRRLTAMVLPLSSEKQVVWSVEDESGVVTVDETGLVTAQQPGSAYVRATDMISGKYGRCRITVKSVKVTAVKLNRTSLGLKMGDVSDALTAKILPVNASIDRVTWVSSDPAIVSVDEEGRLTATGSGTATITAKAGSKKASCRVKVLGNHAVFTLSAVGDVVMGGDPRAKSALNRVTEETFAQLLAKHGRDYPFKKVKHVFQADDVTIANLECTLTDDPDVNKGKKPHLLRGKTDYAQILKAAGIEVCNLANNHTLDFGGEGYKSTQNALRQAGIKFSDFDGYSKDAYVTLEKNGVEVTIGFAGFQTPLKPEPYKAMQAQIRKMKKHRDDIVVVSFHWCDTTEWASRNFPSDRKMARAAIDAGADLVLGSHRHVPAGIEKYKGKYIVYDLANFVAGIKHKSRNGRPLTDSMIFQWSFLVDETGYVSDEGIKVIPCTTTTSTETYPVSDEFGDEGAPINNWQPAILTGQAGRHVIARIQNLSSITIPTE